MKNLGERLKEGRQKFCERNAKYFRGHPRTSLARASNSLCTGDRLFLFRSQRAKAYTSHSNFPEDLSGQFLSLVATKLLEDKNPLPVAYTGNGYFPPDNSSPGQLPSDKSPSQLGQFTPYCSKHNLKIIYIHTCMHTCIHIYIHAYTHRCMHTRIYAYTIHTCIHTYIYLGIHIHLYTVIYIDIFWNKYTYMYTYMHT